jgi:hypothetical protein
MNALAGYRTYISAIGVVVAAVVAFLVGEMTLAEAINAGLIGTGIAGLRAAK